MSEKHLTEMIKEVKKNAPAFEAMVASAAAAEAKPAARPADKEPDESAEEDAEEEAEAAEFKKDFKKQMVSALADKQRQAIYVKTKPKRIGKRDARHVSINTANAKQVWLQELSKVPDAKAN